MVSKRVAIPSALGLITSGGMGVWGYLHFANKPRTFSEPRLISDLLKEKGYRLPETSDFFNHPKWQNNWNKFKKEFKDKELSNIWTFKNFWKKISVSEKPIVNFTENCEKFIKDKVKSESDEKYEAVIKFCSELI